MPRTTSYKPQYRSTSVLTGFHSLSIVYDVIQSNYQKAEFEMWAREEYPPTWEKLMKRRRTRDEDGLIKFNVPRPWKA